MNRFGILLKKELRDMITLQTMLPMIIMLVVFSLLGQFIGSATEEAAQSQHTVTIADMDNTPSSQRMLSRLKESGYEITLLTPAGEDPVSAAVEIGQDNVLIIDQGYEENVQNGKAPVISVHSRLKSFAVLSTMTASQTQNAADAIGDIIVADMLAQNAAVDTTLLNTPVSVREYTHVNDKSAQVSSSAVQTIAMSQTIFVPMIIFMIVIMASQMTATTIANEKGDKTLETLLSTPVSRLAVLIAKMTAAGIVSLIMSLVFLIGFSSYMNGMMGDMSGAVQPDAAIGMQATDASTALSALGLSLSPMQFVLVGIELFTTILIALAISTMLGAMAEDIKGVQTAVMPIMFCVMIPYLISLFADITALPLAARAFLYLIPFTHTFMATAAIIFHNYALVAFGVVYQLVCLVISLYLAVRLFSSDKLFTAKLKKRRTKKGAVAQ
ncbi:MAG: ABC transporter permease [Acetanaerobacterium sp.]